MNDQKEFIEALATIMDVQSQEELEEGIKNLGEEGLKLMYQQLVAISHLVMIKKVG